MQTVESIKSYSQKVIERQQKEGGWLTILECGHKRFVRHYRDCHVCLECKRQKENERSSNYAWTLRTQSGFVLVKGRMFKPFEQTCFDELERFPSDKAAVLYSKQFTISFGLSAVKLQNLQLKVSA